MDLFGIGPLELMLILIVALVVFGPGKLPEMGAKLGSSLREMRKATREFSREIDETRQAIEGPINELKDPMQELAEPFQDAGSTLAGAREALANPSKAIEGYVMGQYASADKPAKTAADEPPPAYPAESADALAVDVVAETDAVTTEATTETEAPSAEAATDETVVDAVAAEPSISEPAAEAGVATTVSAVVESSDSETISGEMAAPPEPGVVSAIAAVEGAFSNATPTSSESVAWVGEMAMAHKMPEAAETGISAADSEIAAPESQTMTSPEPLTTTALSDAPVPSDEATALPAVMASAPEPPQVPDSSAATEPAMQVSAELPPAPPIAARARHRAAPRKSASPNPQPPAGEGGAPSSNTPASQD